MNLFIQLFLAHILGDFFLQPSTWIRNKEAKKWRSKYLYGHVAIHFALLVTITGLFNQHQDLGFRNFLYFWLPALFIAGLHLATDGIKLVFQNDKTKRSWFFIDQFLHLLVLFIVVVFYDRVSIDFNAITNTKVLVLFTAIMFLIKPASFLIKTIISKWPPNFANTETAGNTTVAGSAPVTTRSLENAGELIGILERMLIVLFILLDKWEGVGFLLAAKSVFRFGDLKEARDMKLTEYVLIGTLLSFGIAIVTGVITVRLLQP